MITYASETLVVKESMKQKLITERKILRRIFGPTKDKEDTWRIKTHYELSNLIRNMNIINYINAQRLSWLGHVHQMTNDRMVKKLYECPDIYKIGRKIKN